MGTAGVINALHCRKYLLIFLMNSNSGMHRLVRNLDQSSKIK